MLSVVTFGIIRRTSSTACRKEASDMPPLLIIKYQGSVISMQLQTLQQVLNRSKTIPLAWSKSVKTAESPTKNPLLRITVLSIIYEIL